jgi:alkylhydroperoxidase family enzyme
MPRIEPIPVDELSPESREIIVGGTEAGLYSTPLPLQVFAYQTSRLKRTHQARTDMSSPSLLGGRIRELIRIRSAQLGECQPCMQSRKHDSITDEDVACLLAPAPGQMNAQEAMAVEFLDLLSADHHAIDDAFYARLHEVFTAAQIVELGFTCAETMGIHRFLHTLDIFGTAEPVIRYSPDEVDTKAVVASEDVAASA